MNTAPVPSRIDPENDLEMRIEWSTGERFAVPYRELRYLCPCAGCVNENTGERMIRKDSVDAAVRPLGADPIGRYAICFRWSDGHSTGMYSYDRLWEACRDSGRGI